MNEKENGARDREKKKGKNHLYIVDHYSKNEQLGKKELIYMLNQKKRRKRRKMFVAHDINILT